MTRALLITGASGMLGRDVVAAARAAATRCAACSREELDVTDARAVRAAVRERALRRSSTARRGRTSTAPSQTSSRERGQRTGRRQPRGCGCAERREDRARLHRLRLRWLARTPYVESDPTGAGERLRTLKARRRAGREGQWREPPDRPHGVAVRTRRTQLRRDDARLAAGGREQVAVVTDQLGCPTYTGHLALALLECLERGVSGTAHLAARRSLLVERVRAGDLRAGGVSCRVVPASSAEIARPAPRPPWSVLASERARGPAAAAVAGRARCVPARRRARRRGGRAVKLLVCGGAGFIGSAFVRLRVGEHGDEVVVLDKLTYAGRRENLRELEEASASLPAWRDRGRRRRRRGDRGRRCDRQLRRRDARRPLDRRARRVRADARLGTYALLEAAREPACATCRSPPTRSTARSSRVVHERSPLEPSSPYSATKAGADLLVASYQRTYGLETLICRGSNNYGPHQYPEKLIPLMVLNALAGDRLPVYGDGRNVRNWLFVEDFARGDRPRARARRAGEVYNVGGPDECANIDVVQRDPRAVRRATSR